MRILYHSQILLALSLGSYFHDKMGCTLLLSITSDCSETVLPSSSSSSSILVSILTCTRSCHTVLAFSWASYNNFLSSSDVQLKSWLACCLAFLFRLFASCDTSCCSSFISCNLRESLIVLNTIPSFAHLSTSTHSFWSYCLCSESFVVYAPREFLIDTETVDFFFLVAADNVDAAFLANFLPNFDVVLDFLTIFKDVAYVDLNHWGWYDHRFILIFEVSR